MTAGIRSARPSGEGWLLPGPCSRAQSLRQIFKDGDAIAVLRLSTQAPWPLARGGPARRGGDPGAKWDWVCGPGSLTPSSLMSLVICLLCVSRPVSSSSNNSAASIVSGLTPASRVLRCNRCNRRCCRSTVARVLPAEAGSCPQDVAPVPALCSRWAPASLRTCGPSRPHFKLSQIAPRGVTGVLAPRFTPWMAPVPSAWSCPRLPAI